MTPSALEGLRLSVFCSKSILVAFSTTFANPADYDLIRQDDLIDIIGFDDFQPEKNLSIVLRHSDGTTDQFEVNHTYNDAQIEWVKDGSALNKIRKDGGVS